MNRELKKHAEKVAAAQADLDRMNCICLPDFEVDGVTISSHLCQVRRGRNYGLYTYVQAPDKEAAQRVLDEKYPDFDTRIVI